MAVVQEGFQVPVALRIRTIVVQMTLCHWDAIRSSRRAFQEFCDVRIWGRYRFGLLCGWVIVVRQIVCKLEVLLHQPADTSIDYHHAWDVGTAYTT